MTNWRYVVCYNLALPYTEQKLQLKYWLNFLKSSLHTKDAQWKVVLVGLRQDQKLLDEQTIDMDYVTQKWPTMDFYSEIFEVSSYTQVRIADLKTKISTLCADLLDKHASKIPRLYRAVFDKLQPASTKLFLELDEVYNILGEDKNKVNPVTLRALVFLHDIGQVLPTTHPH